MHLPRKMTSETTSDFNPTPVQLFYKQGEPNTKPATRMKKRRESLYLSRKATFKT